MKELKRGVVISPRNLPFTIGNMVLPQLNLLLTAGHIANFGWDVWTLLGALFFVYFLLVAAIIGNCDEIDVFEFEPTRPIVTITEDEVERFLAMPMVKNRIAEIARRELQNQKDWGES